MVVDGNNRALLIGTMLRNLNQIPIILPPILLALSFHEMAHAWAANRLGDPTARMQGRLSMNPLVHLDPMGTLAIIFFSIVSGVLSIGEGAKQEALDQISQMGISNIIIQHWQPEEEEGEDELTDDIPF